MRSEINGPGPTAEQLIHPALVNYTFDGDHEIIRSLSAVYDTIGWQPI